MRSHNDLRLTRREAIGIGLGAAGALALGRTSVADDAPGPYGPFKVGLQSYSLRGYTKDGKPDLEKAMAVTRDLGLSYWESYTAHVPITTNPYEVSTLKRKLADGGVTVIAYGVVKLTKDYAAGRRIFEFARNLGLGYLSADPDPDSFTTLDRLVEEFNVAVGIHNHGPGHRYDKIDVISRAIRDHNPKIGCCIDTGHFLRSKEDPVRAAEVFGSRTFGVHLKDVKDAKTFTVLGGGDLRTADLLKVLAANKYGYCLALEYEEKPEDPADDIKACLEALKEAAKSLPKS